MARTNGANLDAPPEVTSKIKRDLSQDAGERLSSTPVCLVVDLKGSSDVGLNAVLPCETQSDVQKLFRITAIIVRFVNNLKKKASSELILGEIKPHELVYRFNGLCASNRPLAQ